MGGTRTSTPDLYRLATVYLARRSASTEQLRRYLLRKHRSLASLDRDVDRSSGAAVVEETLVRVGHTGLLDDRGLARTRAAGLIGRGLAPARVRRDLRHQGFDLADPALDSALELDLEEQAVRFAERHRLGPFASGRRRPSFDRDVRALVRAGFGPDLAVRLMSRLAAGLEERGPSG